MVIGAHAFPHLCLVLPPGRVPPCGAGRTRKEPAVAILSHNIPRGLDPDSHPPPILGCRYPVLVMNNVPIQRTKKW